MEYLYKKMRTSNLSNTNEYKLKQDAQDWRYKQDVLVTLMCSQSKLWIITHQEKEKLALILQYEMYSDVMTIIQVTFGLYSYKTC